MLIEITISGILIFILFFVYQKWIRPTGFPPGPLILPIVGSLPLIGTNPLETYKKWRAKYGDIIGFKLGSFNVVVLHDYDVIKEAFNDPVFNGRIFPKAIEQVFTKNKRGLVISEGKTWSEQRRFAVKNLRDFGFGKQSIEAMTHEDITNIIDTFKKQVGQPVSTEFRFSLSVINSFWQMITGERLAVDNPKFQEIVDKIISASASLGSPIFLIPWLVDIAPKLAGLVRIQTAVSTVKHLINSYIEQHKQTYQENNLRDYIDVYLKEIHNTSDSESSFYKQIGDENLSVGIVNLFGAGVDTTSGTLNWALFYLSKNLEIQKNLQDEVDNIVGHFRFPSLNDRQKMPYTEAVMLEVFRISSLAPLGLPHATMEDVIFRGYKIPKGTMILANLYAIHHDPNIWFDPEDFRPERFLCKNETELNKSHPPVVPFSIGKRICLAETLARNNFFLYLTSLLQRFCITRDNSIEGSSTKGGFFRHPPDFKVIFQDRLEILHRPEY